jgi:hydrogenase maturation protease
VNSTDCRQGYKTGPDVEHTLVLGIGNTLLSDEGAGVHLLRDLQSRHQASPRLRLLDAGTLSFTLTEAIEDCTRLIVLDAARLGEQPGAVRRFAGEAMDRFIGQRRLSVHEVGLCDLLDVARLIGRLPSQRALIAIQPARTDWGTSLSPAVAAALPEAAALTVATFTAWERIAAGQGAAVA